MSYNEKTYQSESPISEIYISDKNVSVDLKYSHDEKIHVKTFENERFYYNVTEANGRFSIIKIDDSKWYNYVFPFNFPFPIPKLTVEIPQSMEFKSIIAETTNGGISADKLIADNIEVKTTNAKIEINDLSSKNNTALKSSNGRITLKNSKVDGILDAETTNAKIEINSLSSKNNTTLETSNGRVILKNAEINGTLDIVSSNSEVKLERVNVKNNIIINTTNGRILTDYVEAINITAKTNNSLVSAENITVIDTLDIKTSNGRVLFDMVDFEKRLICKTSNGEISGNILGDAKDMRFNCKTSNGKCNLPSNMTLGNKTLDLKTINANINVEIIGYNIEENNTDSD